MKQINNAMTIYFKSGKQIRVSEEIGHGLIKSLEKGTLFVSFSSENDGYFLCVQSSEILFIAKDRILKG